MRNMKKDNGPPSESFAAALEVALARTLRWSVQRGILIVVTIVEIGLVFPVLLKVVTGADGWLPSALVQSVLPGIIGVLGWALAMYIYRRKRGDESRDRQITVLRAAVKQTIEQHERVRRGQA